MSICCDSQHRGGIDHTVSVGRKKRGSPNRRRRMHPSGFVHSWSAILVSGFAVLTRTVVRTVMDYTAATSDQRLCRPGRYQKSCYLRLRPKPPPPELSIFARASLTVSVRPSTSLPLRAAMASAAAPSSVISTKPNPFGLSGVTVGHNADSLNGSIGFEKRTENRFCDGNTQVGNIYAFHL